ncbi:hypothetical protein B0H17DRAFT_1127754 [Mycena rosella]|uniref:Uncharacterized protein n=1 Tax=Mycena rosella TaxID=1033263 RepID=A0AAD7E1B6_MYCRO|nr:hypothetical protein B0H17DRAFT_1127754 [Mycena rosella]
MPTEPSIIPGGRYHKTLAYCGLAGLEKAGPPVKTSWDLTTSCKYAASVREEFSPPRYKSLESTSAQQAVHCISLAGERSVVSRPFEGTVQEKGPVPRLPPCGGQRTRLGLDFHPDAEMVDLHGIRVTSKCAGRMYLGSASSMWSRSICSGVSCAYILTGPMMTKGMSSTAADRARLELMLSSKDLERERTRPVAAEHEWEDGSRGGVGASSRRAAVASKTLMIAWSCAMSWAFFLLILSSRTGGQPGMVFHFSQGDPKIRKYDITYKFFFSGGSDSPPTPT